MRRRKTSSKSSTGRPNVETILTGISKLVIVGPSDKDIIMKTLCSVCSGSKSLGFFFKNYKIAKHMEFLGYNKGLLLANLGQHQRTKVFLILRIFNKRM